MRYGSILSFLDDGGDLLGDVSLELVLWNVSGPVLV